jgi:hypothetical protein
LRKKCYKAIDFIFDSLLYIYRQYIKFINILCCLFRTPKYHFGDIVQYHGKKEIVDFKKDYIKNIIFYKLINYKFWISEGVLDFYNKDK